MGASGMASGTIINGPNSNLALEPDDPTTATGAVVNHVGSRSFAGNKRISATVNAGSRCWRSGPEANAQRNFLC
jgi:hypothetical protein